VTNVVVERFQAPDTRRRARTLELVRERAGEQLAGRRTWVIDAGSSGPAPPAQRVGEVEGEALPMMRMPSQAAESLPALIAVHVRTGDVLVIRDRTAIGVGRLARECGAHVIWDRRVQTRRPGSPGDQAPQRAEAPALDAWLTAWSTANRRAPRGLAAFIGAPDILSAKEMSAGAPDDSYEQLGWRSLLADIVRQDRAERVGGTVAARPFVAAR
jgi:hypothetical protein